VIEKNGHLLTTLPQSVFALELAALLLDLVFVDREGGLRKRGQQMTVLLDHRGVTDHDARVGAKDSSGFLRLLGHRCGRHEKTECEGTHYLGVGPFPPGPAGPAWSGVA